LKKFVPENNVSHEYVDENTYNAAIATFLRDSKVFMSVIPTLNSVIHLLKFSLLILLTDILPYFLGHLLFQQTFPPKLS